MVGSARRAAWSIDRATDSVSSNGISNMHGANPVVLSLIGLYRVLPLSMIPVRGCMATAPLVGHLVRASILEREKPITPDQQQNDRIQLSLVEPTRSESGRFVVDRCYLVFPSPMVAAEEIGSV
jgi:hypothetical protein